jgi:hypothetical protein
MWISRQTYPHYPQVFRTYPHFSLTTFFLVSQELGSFHVRFCKNTVKNAHDHFRDDRLFSQYETVSSLTLIPSFFQVGGILNVFFQFQNPFHKSRAGPGRQVVGE